MKNNEQCDQFNLFTSIDPFIQFGVSDMPLILFPIYPVMRILALPPSSTPLKQIHNI